MADLGGDLDEEFRESLRGVSAAKEIYDELMPPKGVPVAKKVAKEVDVEEGLKLAGAGFVTPPTGSRRREGQPRHGFRNVFLIFVGVVIGVFFNSLTGRRPGAG